MLGVTYWLTSSELAQWLVFFAIGLWALPAIARRFGVPDEHARTVEGLKAPWRVFRPLLLFAAVWLTAMFFLSGAIDLGAPFWLWALIWPLVEVYDGLGRRDVERHGLSAWTPERPLRDVTVYSLATVPLIALISLLMDDARVTEALLAGALCGVIVFGMGLVAVWSDRRANRRDDAQAG